jgi:hypothetical protein
MRNSNLEAKGSEPPRRLRCAIYTRKSTEEGLEQEFSSLDAQREAAEAFIQSQRREVFERRTGSAEDLRPWAAPLTKRALAGRDCGTFPLNRRRRADLCNSAADVAVSKSGLPPGSMAHFPGKCRFCVNQKPERISKWEISASANMRKFERSLLRRYLADGTRWHQNDNLAEAPQMKETKLFAFPFGDSISFIQ